MRIRSLIASATVLVVAGCSGDTTESATGSVSPSAASSPAASPATSSMTAPSAGSSSSAASSATGGSDVVTSDTIDFYTAMCGSVSDILGQSGALQGDLASATSTPEQTKAVVLEGLNAGQAAFESASIDVGDAPAPSFPRGEEYKIGAATAYGQVSSMLANEISTFESTTFATNAEIDMALAAIGQKIDETLSPFDSLAEIENQLTPADTAAIIAAVPACDGYFN